MARNDTAMTTSVKPETSVLETVESDQDSSMLTGAKWDYSGAAEKTDAREIALVRKLDWYIMPILWLMYWLNVLARNAIIVARLNTLEEDLNLSSSQYQACISVLFAGFVTMGIPSNMILTRVRPSWWIGFCMMVWSVATALGAFCKDYKGLILTRFFLGLAQSAYYPGALYLLGTFYTRKELATRISTFYSANILATAFAGLIALGAFQMHKKGDLAGWQWLFIILGAFSFIIAVIGLFLLPDEPLTTRWLTPEERQLAHDRTMRDTVENKGQTTTFKGLLEAAKDPKLWLLALIQHFNLCTNSYKNFLPTAIQTLGFNNTITLVLTCPPYLIAGAISMYWSWSSGKHNERTWHITIAKLISIAGFVLACASLNAGARYFSIVLFTVGTLSVVSITLGWVSATCSQTKEKKACSYAIVSSVSNAAYVWTPYLWPKSDEPRYVVAMSTSAGLSILTVVGVWLMRAWLRRVNKRMQSLDSKSKLFYAY